jgi:hypothetical protein
LGKSRINDEGDVFWSDSTTNFGYVAVLNGKNLTTDIVGIPTVFHMTGLDSFGNGVWSAAGDKVPLESVFVNRFDLSADAYGGLNYLGARSLAVGENGQVLWYAKDMAGTVSVWLSSPVPEPSFSVVPGLVLLAATLRRPRSRLATIAAWTKKS